MAWSVHSKKLLMSESVPNRCPVALLLIDVINDMEPKLPGNLLKLPGNLLYGWRKLLAFQARQAGQLGDIGNLVKDVAEFVSKPSPPIYRLK